MSILESLKSINNHTITDMEQQFFKAESPEQFRILLSNIDDQILLSEHSIKYFNDLLLKSFNIDFDNHEIADLRQTLDPKVDIQKIIDQQRHFEFLLTFWKKRIEKKYWDNFFF